MQTHRTARRTLVLWTAALLVSMPNAGWAIAADAPKDLFSDVAPKWAVRPEQRNAALIYLSADLATVDRAALAIADLGEQGADLLGTTLDAAQLPKAFEAARAAVNPNVVAKIRTATTLAKCDFEIDYENGYKATMPGLQNMRNAARVLRVDTRIALTEPANEGNATRAAENLAAMFRVARDTAAMRTIISSLVAQRVIDLAMHETRVYLKSSLANAEGRQQVLDAIADLGDDPVKMVAAIDAEEGMLQSFLRDHLKAKSPGESLATSMIEMGNAPEGAVVQTFRRAARKDVERAIDQAKDLFQAVREEWSKPLADQTGESFDRRVLLLGEASVLRALLPALDQAHRKSVETEAALMALRSELLIKQTTDSEQNSRSVQQER